MKTNNSSEGLAPQRIPKQHLSHIIGGTPDAIEIWNEMDLDAEWPESTQQADG